MKKISIIAAFLLVAATATLAMAGPGRMGFGGGGHMNSAVMAALELTNEQTEKIQALHESAKKEIIPVKAQVTTKRAEMKLLWTQTTLDAEKIKATQKEIQALIIQIRDTQTDMRIAFRNLLTPEQTSKLLDNVPDRFIIQKAAGSLKIPLVHGAVAGFEGQLMTIFPEDAGLTLLYGKGNGERRPEKSPEALLGVPALAPSLIATLQAMEVIKVLLNRGRPFRNAMVHVDIETGEMNRFSFDGN